MAHHSQSPAFDLLRSERDVAHSVFTENGPVVFVDGLPVCSKATRIHNGSRFLAARNWAKCEEHVPRGWVGGTEKAVLYSLGPMPSAFILR
jgi:hypothetical protein